MAYKRQAGYCFLLSGSKTSGSLFIAIDIECDSEHTTMQKLIALSKKELKKDGLIRSIDQRIILKKDRPYLINEDVVHPKRFEYYLYHRTYKMIETHKIYVTESKENKRLKDDLLTDKEWENKEVLIQKTGLSRLANPINQTLIDLQDKLSERLEQVTTDINNDANDFVKRQPNSNQLAWTLAHKRWKVDVDNPIYSQVQHMGIIDIMDFVHHKTDYLSAFKNISSRKRGVKANDDDLIACLFGNGTNYGLHKIASVSDRSIASLRTVNACQLK